MATSGGGGGSREGSAKATVADHICQAVQSTSNLLHLMQDSSPSQAHLVKLPKNLLAKASAVKNTGQVLELLPRVISSLDAYMESSLQSAAHLKTVNQLMSNMESSQLRSAFPAYQQEEAERVSNSEKVDSNSEKANMSPLGEAFHLPRRLDPKCYHNPTELQANVLLSEVFNLFSMTL